MGNNSYIIVSTGFAIFSMFFGSGNLVFPLALGESAGTQHMTAFYGLMLTAILIPFVGLFAVLRLEGNIQRFFAPLGKNLAYALPLIVILILCPFGAIPRCITVAHGSLMLVLADTPLIYFSMLSIAIIYCSLFDQEKVIPLLGIILTPFLLLALSLIVYYGVNNAPLLLSSTVQNGFTAGLFAGYQTMDLLAALFFAPTIILYMRTHFKKYNLPRTKQDRLIKAAFIVGAGLLALVYGFFVYLGAAYTSAFNGYPVEQSLTIIAFQTLGSYAGMIVSLAVITACLTTAIILTSVFSTYLYVSVLRKKFPLRQIHLITLSISFVVSTFSFGGIAAFLNPILEICYPILIALTLYALIKR